MRQPTDEEFRKILEKIKAENPGTDIWERTQPNTGVRFIYRGATKPEAKIFRKLNREQREKGALADFDLPNEMYATACVLWPPMEDTAPDGVTLPKLFAAYPMLSTLMADSIAEASGTAELTAAKKA